jgi:hypothetical protein
MASVLSAALNAIVGVGAGASGFTSGMASGHQFDLPFSVELWDEKDTHVEDW